MRANYFYLVYNIELTTNFNTYIDFDEFLQITFLNLFPV